MQCTKMHLSIIFLIFAVAISGSYSNHVRTKRMYGLCPPNFYRIGSLCYFISNERLNWLDAHFECKDKNSKLAEPGKITDRQLRKYLTATDKSRDEIWIGGSYEWNKNIWQWGYSGNDIKYQSFSQMDPRQNLQYHCAALNPEIKYRWSARPCVDTHRFICQHKMPKVSERNRERIYTRWNETYPNQKANEVLLEVVDGGRLPRNQRRRKPATQNSTIESNRLPASSPPFNDQSSPSDVTTQSTVQDKPGHKRSQWSPVRINGPRPNGLNNETVEKPQRKTQFDKIAERKRQKEIRRRKRIQERRRQKAAEAERIRKENEAARNRSYESQNFPPPVTEILMIPEIISDRVVTTTTQRINLNVEDRKEYFPFVEREDEKEVEPSTEKAISTTTTTTSTPNKEELHEKKDTPTVASVLAIDTPPEKYDEYLVKLGKREQEEQQRIEEEQRKRETLKKQREEEMDRLKQIADEQRKEEQRLVEEIKKHQEEDRKIKEEEERVRQEKAKKEAEDNMRMLEKQAARMEMLRKYKAKMRRQKEEKLRLALSGQSSENVSNNDNEIETSESSAASPKPTDITEDDKKMRLQMLRERLQKLTPEQRKRFHELRMQRKKEKQKRSHLVNKRSIKKSIP